jgi:hypothetical protein
MVAKTLRAQVSYTAESKIVARRTERLSHQQRFRLPLTREWHAESPIVQHCQQQRASHTHARAYSQNHVDKRHR